MHDATKRFEIETLLKAGLPTARVAESAWVSVRTVHRVRAETEARSAEVDGTDAGTGTEAPSSPAEARPRTRPGLLRLCARISARACCRPHRTCHRLMDSRRPPRRLRLG